MKKINFAIAIIFVTAILFFAYSLLPEIYYDKGLKCYNNKDYSCSANYMDKVLKFSANNLDAKYYLVKSISALGPSYEREKLLYKFANSTKNDSAKTVAKNTLSDWRKEILKLYPDNYIDQAVSGKNIIRWSNDSFPLKVYLGKFENTPENFKQTVISAFNKWARTIDFIDFQFINNPDDANIIVQIENTPDNNCDNGECKYTTGFTAPVTNQNILKQMKITIYDKTLNGDYVSQNKLYETSLHEIGHALGIMGHSYNPDDNMFSMEQGTNIYTQYRSDVHYLSTADKATIKLLYKLKADITDKPEDNSNLIYPQLIIGTQEDRINKKAEELETYIRQAPEIAAGYINLGGLYAENEEYDKAIHYLQKGLEHAKTPDDKFTLFFDLAYVYYRTEDYAQAEIYCKKAAQIKESDELSNLMTAIKSNVNH